MRELGRRLFVELTETAQLALIAGARDTKPVSGLTHGFYKYPARFSPAFVRAAIHAFTKRGDLCFDPHVGGGTTLVEALATGRNAIGVDISPLAEFVAKVKSTVFSEAEIETLNPWCVRLPNVIDIRKFSTSFSDYAELGYYKHLDHPSRWRLRKAIEQGIASSISLGSPRLEFSAAASFYGQRSGHSTAAGSTRRSMNSAISWLPPLPTWSKACANYARS